MTGGGESPHFLGGALLAAAVGKQFGAIGVVGHDATRVTAAYALGVVSTGTCFVISKPHMGSG